MMKITENGSDIQSLIILQGFENHQLLFLNSRPNSDQLPEKLFYGCYRILLKMYCKKLSPV